MTIKDEKTYNEIEERMEALLAKGTQLGGMDFLSEVEKEELKGPQRSCLRLGMRS